MSEWHGHKSCGYNGIGWKILEQWYYIVCLTHVDLKANTWLFRVG